MKIEFLVAFLDNTWDTQIVDVPNDLLPQWYGDVNSTDTEFDGQLNDWINSNMEKFHGDIALVALYRILEQVSYRL